MYAGVLPVEVDCSEGEAVGANTLTSKFSPSFWKGLAGGKGAEKLQERRKKEIERCSGLFVSNIDEYRNSLEFYPYRNLTDEL